MMSSGRAGGPEFRGHSGLSDLLLDSHVAASDSPAQVEATSMRSSPGPADLDQTRPGPGPGPGC